MVSATVHGADAVHPRRGHAVRPVRQRCPGRVLVRLWHAPPRPALHGRDAEHPRHEMHDGDVHAERHNVCVYRDMHARRLAALLADEHAWFVRWHPDVTRGGAAARRSRRRRPATPSTMIATASWMRLIRRWRVAAPPRFASRGSVRVASLRRRLRPRSRVVPRRGGCSAPALRSLLPGSRVALVSSAPPGVVWRSGSLWGSLPSRSSPSSLAPTSSSALSCLTWRGKRSRIPRRSARKAG